MDSLNNRCVVEFIEVPDEVTDHPFYYTDWSAHTTFVVFDSPEVNQAVEALKHSHYTLLKTDLKDTIRKNATPEFTYQELPDGRITASPVLWDLSPSLKYKELIAAQYGVEPGIIEETGERLKEHDFIVL